LIKNCELFQILKYFLDSKWVDALIKTPCELFQILKYFPHGWVQPEAGTVGPITAPGAGCHYLTWQ